MKLMVVSFRLFAVSLAIMTSWNVPSAVGIVYDVLNFVGYAEPLVSRSCVVLPLGYVRFAMTWLITLLSVAFAAISIAVKLKRVPDEGIIVVTLGMNKSTLNVRVCVRLLLLLLSLANTVILCSP